MARALHTTLVLVALTACGEAVPPELRATPSPLSFVSFNVANLSGAERTEAVQRLADLSPDFAGLQECASCDELASLVGPHYAIAKQRAGTAILYDASLWRVAKAGSVVLGVDDDGWGERVATWARFTRPGRREALTVYSAHFCVTVRSADDGCDEQRQLDYAERLLEHVARQQPTSVVVAGDFNVFDGFEEGAVVRRMIDAGLIDLFRAHDLEGDGDTFQGNDWAPAGRLDYLFATAPVAVLDAFIGRDGSSAIGSDHYPVIAIAELGE